MPAYVIHYRHINKRTERTRRVVAIDDTDAREQAQAKVPTGHALLRVERLTDPPPEPEPEAPR